MPKYVDIGIDTNGKNPTHMQFVWCLTQIVGTKNVPGCVTIKACHDCINISY